MRIGAKLYHILLSAWRFGARVLPSPHWQIRASQERMNQRDLMADEDPNQQDEPRIFTLTEAERTLREIEPLLVEAVESRRKLSEAEEQVAQITARIQVMGGVLVDTQLTSRLRTERETLTNSIREALEGIEATGCVVKDLDTGLLDFPAHINGEEVYLCWRLGEDRIRFWHRRNEGFAGRKPLDPEDAKPGDPIN
jgi:hypothetical protein